MRGRKQKDLKIRVDIVGRTKESSAGDNTWGGLKWMEREL